MKDGYDGNEWDGSVDPLSEVLEALARGEDVGVESGTGTGKTFLGAAIVLWFLACSCLYFAVTLWPDFVSDDFDQAIRFFGGRQRRFGRTGEQVGVQKENERG